jgi:small-conductance mechanosensitive channel
MSIPAELRNARMLVNRGHGDVSDEPDPLHEAAADEIERLDRELEAREKTIELLELDNKRLRSLLRRARQALRSLDEISDEELQRLADDLDTLP